MEAGDRLLPGEDPAASEILTAALVRDGGDVRTGSAPVRVTGDPTGGRLHLADGGTADFDRLLVAVGRTLRTRNPGIWAAGDVTGHPAYTHVAGVHGNTAAMNAVLGLRRRIDLSTVPRVTFTLPEVAAVGESTAGPGPDRRVHAQPLRRANRAITEQSTDPFPTLPILSGTRRSPTSAAA